MTLAIRQLRKTFDGATAVDGLTFEAESGRAFALLGGNGAGKTTTIRMILGLFPPDSGEIVWQGGSVRRDRVRIGYLPEERGLYPKARVLDQLVYLGRLQGMADRAAGQAAHAWLERLGLAECARRRAEELSKGNQQKIQLIAALISDPDLVILDEPFSGLDPVNAELLKDVVLELTRRGRTLIFSSHQMEHVESLCEDIVLLKKGRVALQGNLAAIKRSYGRTNLRVQADADVGPLLQRPGVLSVRRLAAGYEVKLAEEGAAQSILRALADADAPVVRYELAEPSLHEIFIEKVGG